MKEFKDFSIEDFKYHVHSTETEINHLTHKEFISLYITKK